MEVSPTSKRVRINATQDAKGFFKLEATAEVETFDGTDPIVIASKMLPAAVIAARVEFEAAGMKALANPKEEAK